MVNFSAPSTMMPTGNPVLSRRRLCWLMVLALMAELRAERTPEMLIDRVRAVMDGAVADPAGFAERTRLTPEALAKRLSGERPFSSLDLALIADQGATTVEWLLTGRHGLPKPTSVAALAPELSGPEEEDRNQDTPSIVGAAAEPDTC